ncbi:MAG: signal peptidase I [Armatimonadetes bacterium]|nr:signal peptidase I [Armatimonadota bacterium]
MKRARTSFIFSLLFIFAFIAFYYTQFKWVVVSGPSMLPTLQSGNRVWVSKAYWLIGNIRHKDVVVIRGDNPGDFLIKRVYRLPGEVVDFYNIPKNWSLKNGEFRVPDDNIYVLGDNRAVSEDSRAFGPVPLNRVIGKVVVP